MEKVCPWYGQPSDGGRLKNRTELLLTSIKRPFFRVSLVLSSGLLPHPPVPEDNLCGLLERVFMGCMFFMPILPKTRQRQGTEWTTKH